VICDGAHNVSFTSSAVTSYPGCIGCWSFVPEKFSNSGKYILPGLNSCIKLKEPGYQSRLFQSYRRRRRDFNFSTSCQSMLGANPTAGIRAHHVFYEPFYMRTCIVHGWNHLGVLFLSSHCQRTHFTVQPFAETVFGNIKIVLGL
jgi:hypothetical protein